MVLQKSFLECHILASPPRVVISISFCGCYSFLGQVFMTLYYLYTYTSSFSLIQGTITLPHSPFFPFSSHLQLPHTVTMQTATRKEMETLELLHMNKGAGETSYAMNSSVQVNSFIHLLLNYIFLCFKHLVP